MDLNLWIQDPSIRTTGDHYIYFNCSNISDYINAKHNVEADDR